MAIGGLSQSGLDQTGQKRSGNRLRIEQGLSLCLIDRNQIHESHGLTPDKTPHAVSWQIQAAAPAALVLRQASVAGLVIAKHLLHIEHRCSTLALTLDLHSSISFSTGSLASFLRWPGLMAMCPLADPYALHASQSPHTRHLPRHALPLRAATPLTAPGHARWQQWSPHHGPHLFDIHSNMQLHAERHWFPLLVCFISGSPSLLRFFLDAGADAGIHDRSFLQHQSCSCPMLLDGLKQHLAQSMRLQQMAEVEDRCLVGTFSRRMPLKRRTLSSL